jgi:hypothetical protein
MGHQQVVSSEPGRQPEGNSQFIRSQLSEPPAGTGVRRPISNELIKMSWVDPVRDPKSFFRVASR